MSEYYNHSIQIRIARVSHWVVALLSGTLILAPVGLATYAFGDPKLIVQHPWLVSLHINPGSVNARVSIAFFAACLVPTLPVMWGVWELRCLFQGYAVGAVFTVAAAQRFGRFALALMLAAACAPLGSAVLSLALTILGTVPEPSLLILISSTDIGFAVLGGALRVIAWVMRDAARIAEENAGFV